MSFLTPVSFIQEIQNDFSTKSYKVSWDLITIPWYGNDQEAYGNSWFSLTLSLSHSHPFSWPLPIMVLQNKIQDRVVQMLKTQEWFKRSVAVIMWPLRIRVVSLIGVWRVWLMATSMARVPVSLSVMPVLLPAVVPSPAPVSFPTLASTPPTTSVATVPKQKNNISKNACMHYI